MFALVDIGLTPRLLTLALGLLGLSACQATWNAADIDGDGYTLYDGDCGEGDPDVHPGGAEVWYDGKDQDCDGNDADQDGDGYVPQAYADSFPDWAQRLPSHGALTLGDCWDDPTAPPATRLSTATVEAAQTYPGAEDLWYDGVDADCAGDDDFDQDLDGYASAAVTQADGSTGDDCLDIAPTAGSTLDCEGITALTDPVPSEVHPGATDDWYDGIDSDCDGGDDWDKDQDGFRVCKECDDEDSGVFPSDDPETWYNCKDENCDGNDGDQDGDGYLDEDYPGSCASWATLNPGKSQGDCWDDPSSVPDGFDPLNGLPALDAEDVYPKAEDAPYDGVPADCTDDDEEFDTDGDGYASSAYEDRSGDPAGDDCDDSSVGINPGANELCSDSADEDCDGGNNDPSALGCSNFYYDGDSDTYGTTSARCLCTADSSSKYSATVNTDCDDSRSTVNPGASEVCDSANLDEDCDSSADNNDSSALASGKTTYYPDSDKDTYGDKTSSGSLYCDDPSTSSSKYSLNNTDCNDSVNAINPGATEICDSSNTDEDCDSLSDDNDTSVSSSTKTTWYKDADGDTYGDKSDTGSNRCDSNSTYKVSSKTDCNDNNSSINPAATEVCDSSNTDEDCDSLADDNDSSVSSSGKTTYYKDADSDTYGDKNDSGSLLCDTTSTYKVTNKTDCDDNKSAINPGATEICDSSNTDEDCDSLADDNDSSVSSSGKTTYYKDADSDTYGDKSDTGSSRCDANSTYKVTNKTDCDDSKSAINPVAQEVCDGSNTDEDCDSLADDNDSSVASTGKRIFYYDGDVDGYGISSSVTSCDSTGFYTASVSTDCDDTATTISPGGTDSCWDGVDQDCDVYVDEGGSSACYTGGELVFTEVYHEANTDSGTGVTSNPEFEWFEVYNPSATNTVYLETLSFTRQNSTDGNVTFTVGDTVSVGPQAYAVFCYVDDQFDSIYYNLSTSCTYYYGADAGFTLDITSAVCWDSDFELTSDYATTLVIKAGGGDYTAVTVDSLHYDGSNPSSVGWPGSVLGYSVELSKTALTASANDTAGNWCVAVDKYFNAPDALDDQYGTPGLVNDCP